MKTGEVCNRNVVSAARNTTLLEASRLMRRNHVGSLVVSDPENGRAPVGIVTDRDIVIEGVAAGLDQATLTLGEIMGPSVVTANEDDDTMDTLKSMRARGIRRLPVVDAAGKLVGIVTSDDLLESISGELSEVVQTIRGGATIEGWRRR